MAQETLGFVGFALRVASALVLVLLTYNPSGRSFYHWAAAEFPRITPESALAGMVLIIGWTIYLRATLRSIGAFGVFLSLAFLAVLVWLAVDNGWIDLHGARPILWIAIVAVGLILGVGMSWSHVRRRLSGQADVDDSGP